MVEIHLKMSTTKRQTRLGNCYDTPIKQPGSDLTISGISSQNTDTLDQFIMIEPVKTKNDI